MKHYLFINSQTGAQTILAEEGRKVTLSNKKLSAIMKEMGECDSHGNLISGSTSDLENSTIGLPNKEEVNSVARKKVVAGQGGSAGTGVNTTVENEEEEEDDYTGLSDQEIADIKAAKAVEKELAEKAKGKKK